MLNSIMKSPIKMCSFSYIPIIVIMNFLASALSDQMLNIIRNANFPAQKHTVKTKDGYILSLYRIPRINEKQEKRKVILLMHGFADSTEAFLENRLEKSTAFELYKNGYDVWMLNARGNVYSQKHTHFNTTSPEFWSFSWHEIGVFDVPATIDYILEKTNQSALSYIGVSQGVTVLLVTLSELPEYNDKITVANMMAPAVIFKHLRGTAFLPRSIELMHSIETILQSVNINDIFPHWIANVIRMVAPMCSTTMGSGFCRNVFFEFFGPSVQYFDAMLFKMGNHYPSGSSTRQAMHFLQLMATGKFQKYHHDEKTNMKLYGSNQPPEYDLSKITTRMHLMVGTNDWLATAQNIPLLVNKLHNANNVTLSKFSGYNHIDFNYGKHFKQVHKKLFEALNLYDKEP